MARSEPATVGLNSLVPPILPFAIPEAGFDYFATQAHYRSVACRIITASGGFNVVVVTGDRRLSAPPLSTALSEAVAGRYTVIGFPCEHELHQHAMLRFHRSLSASLAKSGAVGEETALPALILFDDADRFSDQEIEEIFKHVHQRSWIGDHRIAAVVFLASTEFLTRLEKPVLRFWLGKRLFVARLRFYELGADEIPAFIYRQLPLGEAERIFSDEATAAIANVSGGDPVVVNRFARRMLDSVAENTSDTPVKANVGSATTMPPDMPREEREVTTFREQPRQSRIAPELGTQPSTRMWRDRGTTLKLCAVAVFCFACVGVVAAVVHIHPAEQDIAASVIAPAKDTFAKAPEALPEASVAPAAESPPEIPALSPSLVADPTAEVTTPMEVPKTIVSTTIHPAASPTGASPIAMAVSPTGTQAPKSTPSASGAPPGQLRLPAAEITALLARGDTLFALGDISSARLFYERAADAGDGRAAVRLGNTFDPAFLDFAHLRVRGDLAMAVSWYGRARELGAGEAEILLKRLEPGSSK